MARELAQLKFGAVTPSKIAIVYDYQAAWTIGILPHGSDFSYPDVVLRFYRAFRRLGLNVDVVPQGASLPDQALLDAIVEQLARAENLNVAALPDGVRSRARGRLRFFFNYGPEQLTLHLPPETKFCLGGPELPVAGMAAIEQDEE